VLKQQTVEIKILTEKASIIYQLTCVFCRECALCREDAFGNGAAMRVAPIGAFFADDLEAVVEYATRSSGITHTHDEAIAGAIAVAVAVALAHNWGTSGVTPGRSEFLDLVLPHVPESEVRSKFRQARDMADNASVQFAVSVLGMAFACQLKTPFRLPYGVRLHTSRTMKKPYGSQ
jgi:ADP-ribosylglycohydrolase